jgi:hypothetical protein
MVLKGMVEMHHVAGYILASLYFICAFVLGVVSLIIIIKKMYPQDQE